MLSPWLQVSALGYRRGPRQILEGVHLSLGEGALIALLGPNGAGKSTLLRLLLGLIRPSQGEIILHDRPLGQWPRARLAAEIAYVPQAHQAVFDYTVQEVVAMGRIARQGLWRAASAADQAAVVQALAQLGIPHLASRPYTALSGGERQSVLLARALAQQSRILILDEPASGLDYGQQLRLYALLRELSRQGYAIVASTHDPIQAREHFEQAWLLRAGRLLACGAAALLLDAEGIARLYDLPVVSQSETI